MKIGFLNNQIDNRGTGNAMFDYAHYNEDILGNESFVFTFRGQSGAGNHDKKALEKYLNRFGTIYNPDHIENMGLDAIYHIKSGRNDGISFPNTPYLVHSVFDNEPHGTVYATISKWMGSRYNLPYVPHIINTSYPTHNLRNLLGIPLNAVVFGRHGGADTFDIPWVWNAIKRITEERDDVWFLLMNTDGPASQVELPDRVVFVAPTAIPENKASFINACDAMLHARQRGETFGIAVGEFAMRGRPVITYRESPERAHIEELKDSAIQYSDEDELYRILDDFMPLQDWSPKYTDYTPELVMAKFKEVFLDDIDTGNKL